MARQAQSVDGNFLNLVVVGSSPTQQGVLQMLPHPPTSSNRASTTLPAHFPHTSNALPTHFPHTIDTPLIHFPHTLNTLSTHFQHTSDTLKTLYGGIYLNSVPASWGLPGLSLLWTVAAISLTPAILRKAMHSKCTRKMCIIRKAWLS